MHRWQRSWGVVSKKVPYSPSGGAPPVTNPDRHDCGVENLPPLCSLLLLLQSSIDMAVLTPVNPPLGLANYLRVTMKDKLRDLPRIFTS